MASEHLRTIECEDDNGVSYVVDEFQDVHVSRTLDGEISRHGGLKELRLRSGGPVNFINEDTFKIVRTGQIIRRVKTET